MKESYGLRDYFFLKNKLSFDFSLWDFDFKKGRRLNCGFYFIAYLIDDFRGMLFLYLLGVVSLIIYKKNKNLILLINLKKSQGYLFNELINFSMKSGLDPLTI
jgi:hypothetical protein